jgi:hypothetical protein
MNSQYVFCLHERIYLCWVFDEIRRLLIRHIHEILDTLYCLTDRLCDLVVRVPDYRPRDTGLDSRRHQSFGEGAGLERDPLSLVGISEELLAWKISGSVSRKSRLTAVGIHCADHVTPLSAKVSTNFVDKRRSLGRYSSLAD